MRRLQQQHNYTCNLGRQPQPRRASRDNSNGSSSSSSSSNCRTEGRRQENRDVGRQHVVFSIAITTQHTEKRTQQRRRSAEHNFTRETTNERLTPGFTTEVHFYGNTMHPDDWRAGPGRKGSQGSRPMKHAPPEKPRSKRRGNPNR